MWCALFPFFRALTRGHGWLLVHIIGDHNGYPLLASRQVSTHNAVVVAGSWITTTAAKRKGVLSVGEGTISVASALRGVLAAPRRERVAVLDQGSSVVVPEIGHGMIVAAIGEDKGIGGTALIPTVQRR